MAKGFDCLAPVGPLFHTCPDASAKIALSVGESVRRRGRLSDMIWQTDEIVAILSPYVVLVGGDLILPGTPAGVGPLLCGETMRGKITGLTSIEITLAGEP